MIRTAIRQPIRTGIRTAINALGAAIRAVFNGVDQYITIPTQTYTGANFSKSFQWTYDASDSGAKVFILGSGQGNTYGLYKSTSDYLTFSYVNTGATQTTITLSALTLVDGTKYTIQISSDGNGVSITAGGQSSSSSDVFDPSANTYTSMMADDAPGNYSAGSLKNAVMTDGSYIKNGDFLQFNGSDVRTATSIAVASSDTITVWYQPSNQAATQGILGGTTYNSILSHSSSETLTFNASIVSAMTVDGASTASGALTLVDGQIYEIEITLSASDTLIAIGCEGDNTDYNYGVMGGFLHTSGSDTYRYNLNDIEDLGNGYGLAPQTGSVEQYPETLIDDQSGYEKDSDDTLYISVPGYQDGCLYRLDLVYTNNTSTPSVYFPAQDTGIDLLPDVSNEELTVYAFAAATNSLQLQIAGPASRCTIHSITVRETTNGLVHNYDPNTDLTTFPNNSRRYPINDKEATITDVVGGQDGTMQNHSADMWQ